MKSVVRTVAAVLVVAVLASTLSCEFSDAGNVFAGTAYGGHLPAEYAIASGDPVLMLECFAVIYQAWEAGTLSGRAQGKAALDLIDLLAVLSRVITALIPVLLDNQSPVNFDDPADFFSSADIDYLADIAANRLLDSALTSGSDPSPLQFLWSVLGILAYEIYVNGATWDDIFGQLTPAEEAALKADISTWLADADAEASRQGDTQFLALTAQLRVVLGI